MFLKKFLIFQFNILSSEIMSVFVKKIVLKRVWR